MNIEDTVNEVEQNCELCGAWTRSHRIPGGYCCHTCWSEEGETKVILSLDAQVLGESVELDERVQGPPWAGGKFRVDKAPQVGFLLDAYDFSEFPHALVVEHPSTTLTVELAADSEFIDKVIAELDPVELSELP